MWPSYSKATRKAVGELLKRGGSLSAYRANKDYGVEPVKDSYAWRFEREIEKRFKVRHAVAVNSGTAALHCGLIGLNLKPGDEVITSPYSFSATVSAIILAGGTPRFADVDPYSFCITPETVKHVLTRRTKAILPVSLFGGMADVRGLGSYGLPVLEDACQAVGARDGKGYSGTQGVGGAYSFNGGKNIPAGEAGAFVTNDDSLAEKARLLMNHAENFGVDQIGLNYRPNELTACVAYHGLLELEERNQRRAKLAWIVGARLADEGRVGNPRIQDLVTPEHVFYVYPFTIHGKFPRSLFVKRMKRHGIPVGAGYITPALHEYKAFRKYARGPLPVVEELSSKTLCILSTLTPDRPLSYAEEVAKAMRESLE